MRSETAVAAVLDAGTGTRRAIEKAQAYLLGRQAAEGFWAGDLEADVSVGAGYIPLHFFLTGTLPEGRTEGIVAHIREKQKPDGSWPSYADGPGDLNVTVQTYFAMKLAGVPVEDEWMGRARDFIRARGGLARVNAITRVWLALFGHIDWSLVPCIPPGLILFPDWFAFSIYEFSSWSRATIVALMALSAARPVCPVPGYAGLSELTMPDGPRGWGAGRKPPLLSPERFFLVLDRILKAWERSPFKPGRRAALRKVEKWIREHQEEDGSWGGILLPWVYSLMALKSLGYPADHPAILKGMRGLDAFFVQDGGALWLQPATSPVWDTAWAVIALRESGLAEDDPALGKAARWLLAREIRRPGDWKRKNPDAEPGCWSFEFENAFYPDLDDTAVVPRALLRVRLEGPERAARDGAMARAADWIRKMQCADGGWAAFDRDNTRKLLAHVPFADFITPLDPTCADVTAHVIEFFRDARVSGRALERGVEYLAAAQEPDGAWYGRWGVNYLYGTGLALAAVAAAPEDGAKPWIRRAADWLVDHQHDDGGWGETCETYEDPSVRGQGPSTASQTAWALMGLLAPGIAREGEAGQRIRRAVTRGVQYLVSTQGADGSWPERVCTGTGFPRAFYLHYDLYRAYFPLLALAQARAAEKTAEERFARTDPSERILLLSHCLRRTDTCTAVYGEWGLECRNCGSDCAIRRLTEAARELGYKGVCVAPGGSMALRFVKETRPRGIVAVACAKELAEGIEAVGNGSRQEGEGPAIVVVPLLKEGCHDTEVDIEQGLRALASGIHQRKNA